MFCDSETGLYSLAQGSSNLSLEVQSAAEFSSNPDQTHLPVIFIYLFIAKHLSCLEFALVSSSTIITNIKIQT